MTLADWIIGFAFGFGVATCALGLWRSLCDAGEERARFELRYPSIDGVHSDNLTSADRAFDVRLHYAAEHGDEASRQETLP